MKSTLLAAILLPSSLFAAAAAEPLPVPEQLDLKLAIQFAQENNFAIRQARERIRQQQGSDLEVRSRQIPNVSASGSYQRNSSQLAQSVPPTDSTWGVDVTASQTLYAGGGVRASVRGSQRSLEAAQLDLKSAVNESLLTVRINFFTVLLAREKVKVQEQNLALLQEQLKTVNERFEAGTVSSFEPLRASVAVDNARVPLITARNEYRLSIETLRQSLGFTTNTAESLRRVPEFLGGLEYTPTTFDLESAFTSAHANRPDLQRLAKLVDARTEALEVVRATRLPTVAAVGGWQLRGAGSNFGSSRDGLYLGLQSQWNIFDGRATSGRVAQARSALEQARLLATEAQLAAEVEVRSAFSSFQEATELADASRRVVAQAEEALRLAIARLAAGSATQLESLQAQVELTTARTNQLQAYFSYNVAVARLRKAMGLPDPFYSE